MKQKTNAPYTRAKSRFAITAIVCLVLSQISGPISLLPTVEAASSFKPTIFVSTEAFLAIDDDDTTADVVLRFGDTLAKTITFNRSLDRFEINDDVYVTGSIHASNTVSGAVVYGAKSLRSSGSLVWEGAASGAMLYLGGKLEGAGLTDCDSGTSKLLWDATTGRFSCGTVTSTTYTAGQGLSLNGANAFSLNTTITGSVVNFQTVSGATVYAKNSLRSSGSLTWEGIGSGAKLFVKDFVSVGSRASGSLLTVGRVGSGTNIATATNATLFSTDQMALGQLEGGAYFGRVGLKENQWGLSNYGATWAVKKSGINAYGIAMSSDGRIQTIAPFVGQLFVSSDYGNSWTAKDSSRQWNSVAMSSDGKMQSAVVSNGQIYTSSDYGSTWTARDSARVWENIAMNSDGKFQIAAVKTSGQIYTSNDYGATWTARESNRDWRGVAISSDGKIQAAVASSGKIYLSFDYGVTWTAKGSVKSWRSIAMSSDGRIQLATASSDQLYLSTDFGSTWTAKNSVRNWSATAMSSDGRIQIALELAGQIYTSTNYGSTWTAASAPTAGSWYNVAMSSDGKIMAVPDYNSAVLFVSHANSFQYGSVAIGTGSVKGDVKLMVQGILSGVTLYATRSFSGAGLSDCDTAGTSKLLWDATTGRFSCGTDQAGSGAWSNTGSLQTYFDNRYVNTSGDTMTGALRITPRAALGGTGALWLSTAGGPHIMFGSGGSRYDVSLRRTDVGIIALSGSLVPRTTNRFDLGSNALRWRDLFLSGSSLHIGSSTLEGRIGFRDTGFEGLQLFASGSYATPTLFLSSGGLIGVNTATPSQLLHLKTASRDAAVLLQVTGVSGGATSSGPNSGGTFADDNSIGTVTWSNVTDAASSNNVYASASTNGAVSHYLKATNFGFNIPSNATVDGITVEIERYCSMGSINDNAVRIVKGGTIGSTDKSAFGPWATSDPNSYTSYGGAADLWGETWTASDINASNFGVALSATDTLLDAAYVDHIRITVHYTTNSQSGLDWAFGSDFSDESKFKIAQSTTLGTNDLFTLTASGSLGVGTTTPKAKLAVQGILSGVTLYATKSFSGAGLTDCSNGTTSKLLWNATTGRFSCGTDQAGGGAWSNTGSLQTYFDNRYVNTSGDTMTGALAIQNGTVHTATTTPLINVRGTMSGRLLNVTGSGASALLTTSSDKPTVRIGGSGSLVIEARSTDPGSAPANTSSLFAQKVGGRSMLHQGSGSTFAASPLQNALFGNLIMTLSTGAGTTVNAYGTTATNDTTVSHPAADQTFGYMTNFATAATSGDDAGTSSTNVAFFRGSTGGANGFFYYARVGVVDTTSIRVFSGMADQSITTMVSADNPTGNHVGFQFSTPRADSNWQFTTKDNTTQNVVNTGLAFTANKVYDLMFTCTKQCAAITWEIRNVTDGTSAQGRTSSNLPTTSAALRMVLGVESETTAAKNIRMQQIYVEADR